MAATRRGPARDLLLPTFHAIQDRVGWISQGALNHVCRRLTVPPADAYGVASLLRAAVHRPQDRQPSPTSATTWPAASPARSRCARTWSATLGPAGAPARGRRHDLDAQPVPRPVRAGARRPVHRRRRPARPRSPRDRWAPSGHPARPRGLAHADGRAGGRLDTGPARSGWRPCAGSSPRPATRPAPPRARRPHRPHQPHGLPRQRRLPRARAGRSTSARPAPSRRSSPPRSWGAAARRSPPAGSGPPRAAPPAPPSTSSATRTRRSPAPSRTAPSWRRTRSRWSRR